MRKVSRLFLVVFLLLLLPGGSAFSAYGSPSIRIDGELRNYQPPCQIVNGRTMIPIRYIIEDQALQGTVAWDAAARKVSITCKEKAFEFKIGSRYVKVNGQQMSLDAAPYIFQNRTYIPLRFLSEQLNARVSWNSQKREVNIRFKASEAEVFAYYYRSLPELQENYPLFTDVALRWFETDENGELFYEYQDNYDQIIAFAHANGIKAHASVVFMDRAGLHSLLSDPQKRQHLIDQLQQQVNQHQYDGVNIDFEFLGTEDRPYFTAFLQELKSRLGTDKQLSVALFACTKAESWLAGYDYAAIGGIVDRVVIMAYDYHYKTSAAGPVAPLWWVTSVVDYSKSVIPADKLLLGLPTYGYDWGDGLTGNTVTASRLLSLKSQYQLTAYFDHASMSPYYTYTDGNGIYHQIWLENTQSLDAKLDAALDNQLAGVSFWRIGNGFNELYDLLEQRLHIQK